MKIKWKPVKATEPVFSGVPVTDVQLAEAYTWYGENCDKEKSKEWTIEQVKLVGSYDQAKKLAGVKAMHFGTVGWIARLRLQGAILSDRTLDWYYEKICELALKVEDVEEVKKPKPSVQDHIAEQVSDLVGDLDVMIDKNSETDVYKFLQEKNVKGPQARRIFDHYQPFKKELELAMSKKKKTDEQFEEFYSKIPKKRINEMWKMVCAIVDNAYLVAQNSIIARKPRTPKTKSSEKIVAKIKYLDRDDDLKVVSVPATNIVGAAQLWVFNVKTRKLGVYYADEGGSLSLKGTTIQGFDKKSSIQKTVRKPEKVLPDIVTGGKLVLRKIMDSIKAKPGALTGRLNTDTLLLRSIR